MDTSLYDGSQIWVCITIHLKVQNTQRADSCRPTHNLQGVTMYPDKDTSSLWYSSQKSNNPSLDESKMSDIQQNTLVSKLSRSYKQGKTEQLSQARRDIMIKCSVGSWIGSWTQIGHYEKNWWNLNTSWSLG